MGWVDDFDYSMSSLGLPVPGSLFADVTTAVTTIKTMQEAIAVAGDKTVPEIAAELGLADEMTAAAGVLASFYVGACIGAALYASAIEGFNFLEQTAVQLDQVDREAVKKALEVGLAAENPLLASIIESL